MASIERHDRWMPSASPLPSGPSPWSQRASGVGTVPASPAGQPAPLARPFRAAVAFRATIVATTLVFAASAAVAIAAPSRRTDLTGPISATRWSQLAVEASMRSADAQLQSLEPHGKAIKRHL